MMLNTGLLRLELWESHARLMELVRIPVRLGEMGAQCKALHTEKREGTGSAHSAAERQPAIEACAYCDKGTRTGDLRHDKATC